MEFVVRCVRVAMIIKRYRKWGFALDFCISNEIHKKEHQIGQNSICTIKCRWWGSLWKFWIVSQRNFGFGFGFITDYVIQFMVVNITKEIIVKTYLFGWIVNLQFLINVPQSLLWLILIEGISTNFREPEVYFCRKCLDIGINTRILYLTIKYGFPKFTTLPRALRFPSPFMRFFKKFPSLLLFRHPRSLRNESYIRMVKLLNP